jgi:hypothetical protein
MEWQVALNWSYKFCFSVGLFCVRCQCLAAYPDGNEPSAFVVVSFSRSTPLLVFISLRNTDDGDLEIPLIWTQPETKKFCGKSFFSFRYVVGGWQRDRKSEGRVTGGIWAGARLLECWRIRSHTDRVSTNSELGSSRLFRTDTASRFKRPWS